MIRTLQLYVARELLKTFALTAIGLTLTFSLCGGVFNMIEAEVLTSVQMLKLLLFILPVALTLTLPVSALFACAMVYGRFASDNEFDACKASGINIHRLLLPAFTLSVLTGAFTFGFTNYILPRFVAGLDAMVRKDLEKVVVHALNTRGYIRQGPYVLYSRKAVGIPDEGGAKRIDIQNAAFLEIEGETLTRCGTAQRAEVDFRNPEGGTPSVEAGLFDIRGLDLKRNQFYEEAEQPFHSVEIPNTLKQKLKWLTLPQLMFYAGHLAELPVVQDQLRGIRTQIREAMFYKYAVEQLMTGERVLRLKDDRTEYEIRAERARQDPNDFRPTLDQVRISKWRSTGQPAPRKDARGEQESRIHLEYTSPKCTMKIKRGLAGTSDTVALYFPGNASYRDMRDPARWINAKEFPLDEVLAPAMFSSREKALSDRDILGLAEGKLKMRTVAQTEPPPLGLSTRIEDARVGTRREVLKLNLEILGIIHSRLAFSASVLVTLILAAALGIIFRGGQMLTAFAISFAPGLLVVVMNITGRQLSENLNTQMWGIGVIWGGIVLVGLADLVVLTRFLKR